MESLNSSLGAGKNIPDSFASVYEDLAVQYDKESYIIKEMEVILSGMKNNIDIEELLSDLGERSGLEDISSFSEVFRISYRRGGNIKDVIRNTYDIISDKMEIEDEIETVVSGSKQEQNTMIIMPVALVGVIKLSSPEFAANFVTPAGLGSTTFAIILFAFSYWLGKQLMDIEM